jgi:4-amino-4-deoxy-L-arabinose transferase-like glycosyltransferase
VEAARRARVALRFLSAFDDGHGLPEATPIARRVGVVAAIVASAWLVLVSFWEIGAPFGAGHYTAATAVATAGENMWKHLTLGAVTHYTSGPPAPGDYYTNHPLGCFWTAALFVNVLGHHEWVCRLPAALMSSAMPLLLYRFGRAAWGPVEGGVSALAFGAVPIALAYANFFALEVPVMFGIALGAAGLARFLQTSRLRFAAVAGSGFFYASFSDWIGFVFTGLMLAALLVRGTLARRFYPALDRRRLLWFIGITGLACAGLLGFHLALIESFGRLDHLLHQGELRSVGSDLPLLEVLESRRYWILLAFTPLAIALGVVAVPVLLFGLVVARRELELVPLAVLAIATTQYVAFKQGADVHFFWPHYFALYFAYALGSFTSFAKRGVTAAARRFRREKLAACSPCVAFGLGVVVVLVMLPDAVRTLVYARKTGGRFNEKGLVIHPDLDKSAILRELAPALPPSAQVGVDRSMKRAYYMDWTLERPVHVAPVPAKSGAPGFSHFLIDTRFSARSAIQAFARSHAVRAYGPIFVADLRTPNAPLVGYDVERVEPTALARYFRSGSHALPRFRESPYVTWELREHLRQTPNPFPEQEPVSPEELRIAHNVAVRRGEPELAARLRRELLAGSDTSVARRFGLLSLLGVRYVAGTSELLVVYFEANERPSRDGRFAIWSEVEAAPGLSLVPRDELTWDVGMPFALPTSLFRRGFIYATVTEILRRPGRERYLGAFRGTGIFEPESGPEEVVLLTLHPSSLGWME